MYRNTVIIVVMAVCFVLALGGGCKDKKKDKNKAPLANAGADRVAFTAELMLFNGSDSTDADGNLYPEGAIEKYSWDFDNSDGVTEDALGAEVEHAFDTAGDFYVTLTVTDNKGENGTAVVCVEVLDAGMYWKEAHHDAASTSTSASDAPDSASLAWTSGNINAVTLSSVIVAHNSAFVYTFNAADNSGSVVALELDCGTLVWETAVKTDPDLWSSSSPTYYAGRVFIGSNSTLYALDAWTGDIIFEKEIGGTVTNSCPVCAGRSLFIGTYSTGELAAFDLYNADELWRYTLPGGLYANGKPVYYDDTVYMNSGGNNAVVAVDAVDGSLIWEKFLPDGVSVWGDMSIGGDRLWAATYNMYTFGGHLYSLDLLNGGVITETEITGTNSAPAYVNGVVYISSGIEAWSIGQVTVLVNADNGDIINTLDFGGYKCSSAVADSMVFLGDINAAGSGCDHFYALNAADGSAAWDNAAGGASPAIANGRVYTIGSDGRVYCYK
jgi:outer membrane protein assembly factor BamB